MRYNRFMHCVWWLLNILRCNCMRRMLCYPNTRQ